MDLLVTVDDVLPSITFLGCSFINIYKILRKFIAKELQAILYKDRNNQNDFRFQTSQKSKQSPVDGKLH